MIATKITIALHNMNVFLLQNTGNVENMAMFICLFVCIVYALIMIGILIYQLKILDKSKKSIYKCLTSLLKSVVSSVSESLKTMCNTGEGDTEKVEENNSKFNKQKENILKIFTSSGDASMKSKDKSVLITATLFLLLCALICTCVLSLTFPDITQKLYDNSPHMGFILGTSGYGFSVLVAVDNLIHLTNCHGVSGDVVYKCEDPNNDPASIEIRNQVRIFALTTLSTFITYYHSGRFGGETNQLPPYSYYEETLT